MLFRQPNILNRNQRGFMLLEVLGALAIASLISLVVSMANAQILDQSVDNNNYTTGSRHTLNALHWIGCDTQGAQTINGADDFPDSGDLVLGRTDWDNTTHTITYTVDNGRLLRSYSVNGSAPLEFIVAEYISTDPDLTHCSSDNGVLTLTITACVGEGSKLTNVTKKREISSRASL